MRKRWHLVSALQRLSSGFSLSVRMRQCLLEGHVSLNIIEEIVTKPKIFTETRTQDSFGFVTLVPVISSSKRTNFDLASFFS
jgi:hypothetical protein